MIFNPVYGGASAPNLGSKTITTNGTYTAATDNLDGYDEVIANVPNTYAAADEGKVVSNGALVSQGSATYTSNNTYDTTLINSVTVNVSGGGGGRTVYESTSTPTASDGNVGDFCVEKTPSAASIVSDEGANRLYTFNLTKLGRDTNLSFTYYGISGIELVFEDSGGNQYLLSQASDKNAKVKNNNATSYIGVISTGYSESNGLPGIVTASGTIPSGYKLTTIKVAQRNSTSWKDFWVDFNVVETVNGVSNTIFTKSGMSYSDWNGPGTWTTFSLTGGEYVNTYAKVDASTWVPVSDLTPAQIVALGLTPM